MRFAAIAGVVLVLAGCGGGADPVASPSPSAVPQSLQPGTEWLLVAPPSIEGPVTITFSAEQVSGQGPVNRYSAPFTAGEDGSIDIGPVTSTEMGGTPQELAAEEAYFALLDRAKVFDVDEVQLTLRADAELLLSFALPDSPAVFGRGLVGLTVKKARDAALEQGYEFRVVSVDGESRPVTMDYRPQRLNATVVDGRVTAVTVG